ncbi:hypothetical protein [Roseivivax marinus]|uniref:hypothetical protein n=1 Tax=Roseivivax marinus TaxID=1379903 RepID=UPI00273E52F8|nr:hypothetical protein [Roseivivax marinus]
MDTKAIGLGVAGLVAGVVIGTVTVSTGPSLEEIGDTVTEAVTPATEAGGAAGDAATEARDAAQSAGEGITAVAESVAALDERLAAIEEQLSGMGGTAEAVSALESQVAELRGAVDQGLSASADAQEGLEGALSGLGEGLSGLAGALSAMGGLSEMAGGSGSGGSGSGTQTADGESGAGGQEPQAQSPAAQAVAEAGELEGIAAGETASFADGAVRVFVSRVDAEAGAARLSINGALAALSTGETYEADTEGGPCMVALDSVSGRRAVVSAACGDALPAPEGARAGNTIRLANGDVRVFVSGVSADSTSARIAVNGVVPQTVALGDSVDAGDGCSVTVDGIDRGHVSVSSDC